MRCEVVAIGTELLLGQIMDTNSAWIGEQLALAGIDSHFQVKVGDNFERMEAAMRQGLERSDAVICCGGLGPTQDDITREVIARIMGVELERDEAIVARIRAMFESRGRVMTDNNKRQADIPLGASPIAEMPGTAPGLVCPLGDKVIYAVPGVPREMKEMMAGTILPDLQRRSGETAVIRSRVIRTWGHSESGLAEMLALRIDELDGTGNPTLAFQASGIEGLKIRITAKAGDEAAAEEIIAAEEALVRAVLGDVVFGVDEETMEVVILKRLKALGLTLAVAEELTGGVLTSRLTEIEGAEAAFKGALISPPANAGHSDGAAAEPAEKRAIAEAARARDTLGADIGIAAIRPSRDEGHPNGMVFLGIVTSIGGHDGARDGAEHLDSVALPGDKTRLRNYAVISLLNYLRKVLGE
jgi:nicotinamide-nucleotide amidase